MTRTWYLDSLPGSERSLSNRNPSNSSTLSSRAGSRALAPAATPICVPFGSTSPLDSLRSTSHWRFIVTDVSISKQNKPRQKSLLTKTRRSKPLRLLQEAVHLPERRNARLRPLPTELRIYFFKLISQRLDILWMRREVKNRLCHLLASMSARNCVVYPIEGLQSCLLCGLPQLRSASEFLIHLFWSLLWVWHHVVESLQLTSSWLFSSELSTIHWIISEGGL